MLDQNDIETLATRISHLPQGEAEAWEQRKEVLRDGLNSLNARLASLPKEDRNAVLSLLYKQITDLVFNFHLAAIMNAHRCEILAQPTGQAKREVLERFKAETEELAALYGVR
jgi:hypothetical protein